MINLCVSTYVKFIVSVRVSFLATLSRLPQGGVMPPAPLIFDPVDLYYALAFSASGAALILENKKLINIVIQHSHDMPRSPVYQLLPNL